MRKLFIFALLACFTATQSAVFGPSNVLFDTPKFDPRRISGLVGWYDFSDASKLTLNGAGISRVQDKSWVPGRRENLLVQSEAFNTTWTRFDIAAFGVTDTGGAGAGSFANTARTLDPLGGNTADFVQEDATLAASHAIYQSMANLTVGQTYVLSVYIKPAGRSWALVCVDNPSRTGAFFDLTTPAVGTKLLGANGTITAAANGFFLCTMTFTAGAATGNALILASTADNTQTYNGNNTSGLFLWGAQLRRNTSSSVYVPTTTVVEDASHDLLQGTAANQPLISRADSKGNLLVRSEEFQTTWTRVKINAFGATDTGAAGAGSFANTSRTADPSGLSGADFIQEDNTSGTHFTQISVAAPASTLTFSVSIKAAGRADLRIYCSIGSDAAYAIFHLSPASFSNSGNSGNATFISASIVEFPVASGWFRCSITGVFPAAGNFTPSCIFLAGGTDNYAGDNASGLFFWGASLRQSTWDSDYIATGATIAVPGLNGRTTGYFDGTAHYLKTAAFNLNQPTTVVWVGKQVTWTANDAVFDGYAFDKLLYYQITASPRLYEDAGTGAGFTSVPLGNWAVHSVIFNGASSFVQSNNDAASTGNVGAGNAGGFTLAATGAGGSLGNIQTSQVLLYNRVLDAGELAAIKKWAQSIGGAALAF